MVLWYDDKISNYELGYTLYLDFKEDKEYWLDHEKWELYGSKEAGGIICAPPIKRDYLLKERNYG